MSPRVVQGSRGVTPVTFAADDASALPGPTAGPKSLHPGRVLDRHGDDHAVWGVAWWCPTVAPVANGELSVEVAFGIRCDVDDSASHLEIPVRVLGVLD